MQAKNAAGQEGLLLKVCYDCGDLALSIRPNLSLDKIVAIWRNENGAKKDDTNLVAEFQKAKERLEAVLGDGPKPFRPAGSVSNGQAYGFRVFQERGLITSTEYYELLSKVPEDVKLTASKTPWQGPNANRENMYLIDLKGLPLDVILSLRRVHIYYDCKAAMLEEFLTPEHQLLPQQHNEMFRYVVSQHMAQRPEKMHPSSARPHGIEKLREMHGVGSEELKGVKRSPDAAESQDSSSDATMSDGEGPQECGPGQVSGTHKKVSTKKSAKKPRTAASTTASGTIAQSFADDNLSLQSGASKEKSVVASLDPDMVAVAEKHLATPQGSSVKCLQLLRSKVFLLGPDKCGLVDVSFKSLASAVTHVRGSRNFFCVCLEVDFF